MHVKDEFAARAVPWVIVLLGGTVLMGAAGCHRSPSPDVVATVNNRDILRADLDRKYQIWKTSQGESPQQTSPQQSSLAQLEILRQMIDEEILQQRATKLNVAATDEDVNAAVTEQKAPYTQEEFDKRLKQHNETLEEYKNDLRHSLTESKLLNKEIDSKIDITDAEIAAYYAQHKADYNFIEPRYNIARIAVSSNPSAQTTNLQNNKASSDADARNKIQALRQKLENGEDFGALAMSYSEDKDSAPNGGDMGFVLESQLRDMASKEIYDAITSLKPGQFTAVLPVNNGATTAAKPAGYAIYRLLSKEAAGQRDLSDVRVKAAIRQGLRDGHAQLLKTAYLEMLRDEARVHNYLADQILKDGAK